MYIRFKRIIIETLETSIFSDIIKVNDLFFSRIMHTYNEIFKFCSN